MDLSDYQIKNIDAVYSPALALYPSIIQSNITRAIDMAGKNVLRPHIKTCKTPEVVQMMMDAGITHFKCATIAELELLGLLKVKDALLAYQPVASNLVRLKNIIEAYPNTAFSCLVDNGATLANITAVFNHTPLNVFIDVNAGMNRTGVAIEQAGALMDALLHAPSVNVQGIHAYDGHIADQEPAKRQERSDETFRIATHIRAIATERFKRDMDLVIGGTPTFPFHAARQGVQCSPGTFVFWDAGYSAFVDMPFTPAALVICRVVSIISDTLLCLDLGYKAIASENTLHKRVRFLNKPDAEPVSHSEEHMVVRVADTTTHSIGDVWYSIPYHICPTVALYSEMEIIEDGYASRRWQVTARNRKINY